MVVNSPPSFYGTGSEPVCGKKLDQNRVGTGYNGTKLGCRKDKPGPLLILVTATKL